MHVPGMGLRGRARTRYGFAWACTYQVWVCVGVHVPGMGLRGRVRTRYGFAWACTYQVWVCVGVYKPGKVLRGRVLERIISGGERLRIHPRGRSLQPGQDKTY